MDGAFHLVESSSTLLLLKLSPGALSGDARSLRAFLTPVIESKIHRNVLVDAADAQVASADALDVLDRLHAVAAGCGVRFALASAHPDLTVRLERAGLQDLLS